MFAPVLLLNLGGRRGWAVAGLLIAAAAVWVTANRAAYAAPDRHWAITQEQANANILASLHTVQALDSSVKRVVVAGLRVSYHPWLSSDFVRHELGRERSWTVMVPRDGPHLVSPPVTLASPPGVDPASFDRVLVYDAAARLSGVTDPRQSAASPPDVVLVPELKPHLEKLRQNPRDFMSLLSAGILYGEWGWPERSVDYLARAISAGPDNPYPYFYLGQAREAMGDREGARKHYEEAVARDKPPLNAAFRQALEALHVQQR